MNTSGSQKVNSPLVVVRKVWIKLRTVLPGGHAHFWSCSAWMRSCDREEVPCKNFWPTLTWRSWMKKSSHVLFATFLCFPDASSGYCRLLGWMNL